jgi:hypothetical protein
LAINLLAVFILVIAHVVIWKLVDEEALVICQNLFLNEFCESVKPDLANNIDFIVHAFNILLMESQTL